MDCFGSTPCLRCTIHYFSDEADESLFRRVRDHVGGCSLGLAFYVFHLSLESHRFGEDVNRALSLGLALNRFYLSRSFPRFWGPSGTASAYDSFSCVFPCWIRGSSPEFRTSSEGCAVVNTTISTKHFFTSTASSPLHLLRSVVCLYRLGAV